MLLHYKILGIGFIPFIVAMALFGISTNLGADDSESEGKAFFTDLGPGDSIQRKIIWSEPLVLVSFYPKPSNIELRLSVEETDGTKLFTETFVGDFEIFLETKPGMVYAVNLVNLGSEDVNPIGTINTATSDEEGNFLFNSGGMGVIGVFVMGVAILIFIIAFAISIKEWRQGKTGFWHD